MRAAPLPIHHCSRGTHPVKLSAQERRRCVCACQLIAGMYYLYTNQGSRISIIFRLTQPVIACICGLISVVLKLTSHPLHAVFPMSLYALQKVVALPKIEKIVFVVCPNDTCNCLYNLEEAQRVTHCNAVHFGKKCGCELAEVWHLHRRNGPITKRLA